MVAPSWNCPGSNVAADLLSDTPILAVELIRDLKTTDRILRFIAAGLSAQPQHKNASSRTQPSGHKPKE
jgi:hypothetical protein